MQLLYSARHCILNCKTCFEIGHNVTHLLFQTLHYPLKLKYQCQRQTTWKLAINSLISILEKGLPVAYKDTRTGSSIIIGKYV